MTGCLLKKIRTPCTPSPSTTVNDAQVYGHAWVFDEAREIAGIAVRCRQRSVRNSALLTAWPVSKTATATIAPPDECS